MSTISWTSAGGGDWEFGSNWSGGAAPGPGDDAVISLPGVYAVSTMTPITVGSVTLNDPGAILEILAPFDIVSVSPGSNVLELDAGTVLLTTDLEDATIDLQGGTFVATASSILTNVTVEGFLNLSESIGVGGTLTLDSGLQLQTSFLNFSDPGNQSVAGSGVIDLRTTSDFGAGLADVNGGTLTLDSGISVVGVGPGLGGIEGNIINQGTIEGDIGIEAGSTLTNQGQLFVAGNEAVYINDLANSGQVSVTAGGVLTLGSFTALLVPVHVGHFILFLPGGSVTERGATLNLDGTIDLGSLNTVSRTGGVVSLQGTLALAGGTLNIGASTALGQLRDNGMVNGGTIHDAGGGMVYYGTGEGELQDVTYQGLVNLTPAQSSLIIED